MRLKIASNPIHWILIIIACIYSILPIFFIVSTALKTNPQTIQIPPIWIFNPDWSHFKNLLLSATGVGYDFRLSMINSLIVTIGATAFALAIGFPCAYSISRFKTGGKNFSFWILSFRFAPPVVFLLPMYILYMRFNLLDTHLALILIYLTFNLPLTIWVLKSFIDEIPRDFEESAFVDGCSRLGAIYRITLPVSAPAVVAVAILNFFITWNEFIFAFVFTSRKAITMPAQAAVFITQYTWLWADLCASLTLMMIPLMIFAILIQKQMVRGFTMGAIKG